MSTVAVYGAPLGFSNYHSLQTQVTLRPTHGISYQATYTWSKNLGIEGNTVGTYYTDPTNRRADYTYAGSHRSHDFRGIRQRFLADTFIHINKQTRYQNVNIVVGSRPWYRVEFHTFKPVDERRIGGDT